MLGYVQFYNVVQKFGFIAGDNGVEYFMRGADMLDEILKQGNRVTFIIGKDRKGLVAKEVKRLM